MKLNPYQEIVGTLMNLQFVDDAIKMIFSIRHEVELPNTAVKRETLQKLIGDKIGAFNCDGKYKIRKIKSR